MWPAKPCQRSQMSWQRRTLVYLPRKNKPEAIKFTKTFHLNLRLASSEGALERHWESNSDTRHKIKTLLTEVLTDDTTVLGSGFYSNSMRCRKQLFARYSCLFRGGKGSHLSGWDANALPVASIKFFLNSEKVWDSGGYSGLTRLRSGHRNRHAQCRRVNLRFNQVSQPQ